MHGGGSYLPLDAILPPPADDMFDDIREGSDDDVETWRPNPESFQMATTGFQNFKMKLQRSVIRPQRYLDVIRNSTPGLFADYDRSVVADEDVAQLR